MRIRLRGLGDELDEVLRAIETGFTTVGTATAGSDGTFSASFPAGVAGNYRATVNGEPSPAVQVVVLNQTLSVAVTGKGSSRTVRVTASGVYAWRRPENALNELSPATR